MLQWFLNTNCTTEFSNSDPHHLVTPSLSTLLWINIKQSPHCYVCLCNSVSPVLWWWMFSTLYIYIRTRYPFRRIMLKGSNIWNQADALRLDPLEKLRKLADIVFLFWLIHGEVDCPPLPANIDLMTHSQTRH